MSRWVVRARLFLGNNLGAAVGVLVILALAGGFLAYPAHVDPGTDTERVEESSWSSTGQYAHQASVTVGTTVFDRGDVLRNRASYFAAITPTLNGTFVYEYRATDGGDLRVAADQTLVVRSVAETGSGTQSGETVEYWRLEEPLGSRTVESVAPDDSARVPFSVNVSRITGRVEAIEEELGGTPGQTEVVVRSDVRISGTRNGQEVDTARSYRMQIDADTNVYSVDGTDPETESGQQFREVTVEATYGPLRTIGGPLLVLVSLAGLLGLAVGRYLETFTLTDAERAWLDYASTHDEFEDWISTGRVPAELLDGPQVDVETLDGLVDVAIDSSRRVIEDRDRGLCVIILDEVVYSYEIPPGVLSESRSDPLATPPERSADVDGGADESGDESADETGGEPTDETGGEPTDETTDGNGGKSGDENSGGIIDWIGSETGDGTIDETGDGTAEDTGGETIDESGDEAAEDTGDETIDRHSEDDGTTVADESEDTD